MHPRGRARFGHRPLRRFRRAHASAFEFVLLALVLLTLTLLFEVYGTDRTGFLSAMMARARPDASGVGDP